MHLTCMAISSRPLPRDDFPMAFDFVLRIKALRVSASAAKDVLLRNSHAVPDHCGRFVYHHKHPLRNNRGDIESRCRHSRWYHAGRAFPNRLMRGSMTKTPRRTRAKPSLTSFRTKSPNHQILVGVGYMYVDLYGAFRVAMP